MVQVFTNIFYVQLLWPHWLQHGSYKASEDVVIPIGRCGSNYLRHRSKLHSIRFINIRIYCQGS